MARLMIVQSSKWTQADLRRRSIDYYFRTLFMRSMSPFIAKAKFEWDNEPFFFSFLFTADLSSNIFLNARRIYFLWLKFGNWKFPFHFDFWLDKSDIVISKNYIEGVFEVKLNSRITLESFIWKQLYSLL